MPAGLLPPSSYLARLADPRPSLEGSAIRTRRPALPGGPAGTTLSYPATPRTVSQSRATDLVQQVPDPPGLRRTRPFRTPVVSVGRAPRFVFSSLRSHTL